MKKLIIIGAVAAFAVAFTLTINVDYTSRSGVGNSASLISGVWEVGVSEVEARSRSRSRSSSRASSRSSSRTSYRRSSSGSSSSKLWNRSTPKSTATTSSGGYKKPTTKSTPITSGGYKKPGSTAPTTTAPRQQFRPNATGNAVQRRAASSSVAKHRTETSKFAKGKSPTAATSASTYNRNPLATRARTRSVNYNSYYSTRNSYYSGIGYRPGIWVGNSYSSFGMYDSLFMWSMLSRSNSRMYYHHRSEPGFQEWRREADRMARDNDELRAQLDELDAKVANVSGPVDPNYLPEGVDPSVALSAEVVASGEGELKITMGTGGTSGNYFAFCNSIKRNASAGELKVDCKNTNGSLGNLQGLINGEFGAIMVQSDVLNEYLRQNPGVKIDALQSDVYPEVVYLIVNERSGIDSIKDLKPRKHRLYYAGSGATKTMQGFARQDSRYVNIYRSGTQVNADVATLRLVANNPNGAMLYVCGLRCDLIQKANDMFGDQLRMAAVDDNDFNDAKDQFGNRIYNFVDVPRIYENLMPNTWGSDDIETLAVSAIFVLSKDWAEDKGMKGLSALETALWPAMKEIQDRVGVPE